MREENAMYSIDRRQTSSHSWSNVVSAITAPFEYEYEYRCTEYEYDSPDELGPRCDPGRKQGG